MTLANQLLERRLPFEILLNALGERASPGGGFPRPGESLGHFIPLKREVVRKSVTCGNSTYRWVGVPMLYREF